LQDNIDDVKMGLQKQIKEQDESVANLKLKQTYLETTFKNAQSHINDILGRR